MPGRRHLRHSPAETFSIMKRNFQAYQTKLCMCPWSGQAFCEQFAFFFIKKERFRISAGKFHIFIYMAEKTIISIWNSIPFQLVKKKLLVLVQQGHGHLWIWGWGGEKRGWEEARVAATTLLQKGSEEEDTGGLRKEQGRHEGRRGMVGGLRCRHFGKRVSK